MKRRTLLQAGALAPLATLLPTVADATVLQDPYPAKLRRQLLEQQKLLEIDGTKPGAKEYVWTLQRGVLEALCEDPADLSQYNGYPNLCLAVWAYFLFGETFWRDNIHYTISVMDVEATMKGPVYRNLGTGLLQEGVTHVANKNHSYDLHGTSVLMPWYNKLLADPGFDIDMYHIKTGGITEDLIAHKIRVATERFKKVDLKALLNQEPYPNF